MYFARCAVLAALMSSSLTFGVGCSSSDEAAAAGPNIEEGDEQALTEAKVLSKGVSYPSGLAVANNHVYFGANHFVASGDPELDQQFAYWEGKFSRVALTGGRPQTVVEVGPINRVRASGSKLFYAMSDGCWISSVDTGGASPGQPKSVYDDNDCDGEGPGTIAGFEIANDKLIVVRTDGEVKIGNLDGTNMKKLGEIRIGDWGDIVDQHAIADGNLYIVTQTHLPQAVYKMSLTTGHATKLFDTASPWQNVTSDGNNIYFSEHNNTVSVLAKGASAPKQIAKDLGTIVDLASDGQSVFIADAKRGAIYQVRDALTPEPKRQKKLAAAKGIQSLVLAEGTLFFGSHLVENRKAAGVIGAVKLLP